jgi:ATP/ADP translocase
MRAGITWLTGAKKEEQSRVILASLALFCLLISYYLIKPLRNSKFLEEFLPSHLPFVYSTTAFLSFVVTKIFSHLAQTVEKYRLVSGAYITIIICKIGLGTWLNTGGKAAVVCFYFFASVYFLLAVATLWACINDMFTSEQSERCFGFVALGATVGGILGAKLSHWIAESEYRDYALQSSIVFLALALVLILIASRSARGVGDRKNEEVPKSREKGDFWGELRALGKRPYLRNIAFTVLLLAVATTGIEFVTQTVIDRELAREQYDSRFSQLEGTTFEDIYLLKSSSADQRTKYLGELAEKNQLKEAQLVEDYDTYREELEVRTRSFYSVTYFYQGLLGVLCLLVVARFLFPRVGMRYCYMLLPGVALVGFCLFGLTVDLMLVQVVLALVGAFNYSLNNAAKEILYCATNTETLFRFKPMIEGPCMRAGDVLSSILRLGVMGLAAKYALDQVAEINVFIIITCVLLAVYLRAAWLAGKTYDFELRAAEIKRDT